MYLRSRPTQSWSGRTRRELGRPEWRMPASFASRCGHSCRHRLAGIPARLHGDLHTGRCAMPDRSAASMLHVARPMGMGVGVGHGLSDETAGVEAVEGRNTIWLGWARWAAGASRRAGRGACAVLTPTWGVPGMPPRAAGCGLRAADCEPGAQGCSPRSGEGSGRSGRSVGGGGNGQPCRRS
jgi:hypothetical protein